MSVLVSRSSKIVSNNKGTNVSSLQHEAIVLGIVKRRPLKSIPTNDLPRLIAMCERCADNAEKDKSAEKFGTLALRLTAELKLRETGHKPFAPNSNDRYTAKDLPEKAVKALFVLGKIVARFDELLGENEAQFLLTHTTNEAVAAFEKGEAYGMKTRSAFLPKVFRHLLVQIAKNLKDPVPAVQAFTNDAAKMQMLDTAWGGGNAKDTTEPQTDEAKPLKVVTDERYANKVHPEERIAGRRAMFHVYREVDGKKDFEASYANTAEDAANDVHDTHKLLGKFARVYAVVVCNKETKL